MIKIYKYLQAYYKYIYKYKNLEVNFTSKNLHDKIKKNLAGHWIPLPIG